MPKIDFSFLRRKQSIPLSTDHNQQEDVAQVPVSEPLQVNVGDFNPIKEYKNVNILGIGNTVAIFCKDGKIIRYSAELYKKDGINIVIQGNGNEIILPDNCSFVGCEVHIFGNNNTLRIGRTPSVIAHSLFHFGQFGDRRRIEIGEHFYGSGHFRVMEDDTAITVGDNCTFSWNVLLMATDYHSILNAKGEVINRSKGIALGSNVWVGCNSTILKNVSLASSTIVATGSIVTKSFEVGNIAIAGNPAKIVKDSISWDMQHPHSYKSPSQVIVDKK